MPLVTDAYQTLGVADSDGASAICAAHRDLMRRHRVASRYADEVARAFATLCDPGRRDAFDPPVETTAEPVVDLLGDFAGTRPSREEVRAALRRNFTTEGPPKSGHIEVLTLTVRVADRTTFVLAVPAFHPCAPCHGAGSIDLYPCRHCHGTGIVEERQHIVVTVLPGHEQLVQLGIPSPVVRINA